MEGSSVGEYVGVSVGSFVGLSDGFWEGLVDGAAFLCINQITAKEAKLAYGRFA